MKFTEPCDFRSSESEVSDEWHSLGSVVDVCTRLGGSGVGLGRWGFLVELAADKIAETDLYLQYNDYVGCMDVRTFSLASLISPPSVSCRPTDRRFKINRDPWLLLLTSPRPRSDIIHTQNPRTESVQLWCRGFLVGLL